MASERPHLSADFFEPDPPLRCAWCDREIPTWRNLDNHWGGRVWQQGVQHPVEQRHPGPYPHLDESMMEDKLRKDFLIYGACPADHWNEAKCAVVDELWVSSSVVLDEQADGNYSHSAYAYLVSAPGDSGWDDDDYEKWIQHRFLVRFRTRSGAVFEYPVSTRCGSLKAVVVAMQQHTLRTDRRRDFPLNVECVDLGEGFGPEDYGDHAES